MTLNPRLPRVSWRDLASTPGPYVLFTSVAFPIAVHFILPWPRTGQGRKARPGC